MENLTEITNDLKNGDSVLYGIIFKLKEEKLSGDGELILDRLMKFRQNNKDNINLLGQEILNIERKLVIRQFLRNCNTLAWIKEKTYGKT